MRSGMVPNMATDTVAHPLRMLVVGMVPNMSAVVGMVPNMSAVVHLPNMLAEMVAVSAVGCMAHLLQ